MKDLDTLSDTQVAQCKSEKEVRIFTEQRGHGPTMRSSSLSVLSRDLQVV